MRIRTAELADIDSILLLDHSYLTDHVWQMSVRQANARQADDYGAQFSLAALPRQLQVPYPHDLNTLRRTLHRCDYVWVMQNDDSREILGYVGMSTLAWQNTGWIPCLAVAPQARRAGVASRLVTTAIAQARASGLHSVTIDIQTKNYPATRFCQTRGFRFAGYADNYYSSSDIALFFAYRIR